MERIKERIMNCNKCGTKLTLPEWEKSVKKKEEPSTDFSCGKCGKDIVSSLIYLTEEISKTPDKRQEREKL